MGTDDLFRKRQQGKLKRTIRNRGEVRPRILIVCEGEKTEPLYFQGFRLSNVVAEGFGANCDSLVEIAIDLKRKAIKDKEPYDQIWCVFDRDSCPPQNFNRAFELASSHQIQIAYTNEAFELWYLLHFDYHDSALSRKQYGRKLSKALKFKYQKKNPQMFDLLYTRLPTAIRNAKRLMNNYNTINPECDNPSTNVHTLVEILNKWVK